MNRISSKLTVCFDGIFWIGIFEEVIDGELRASKITFGKEPKETEILTFVQTSLPHLSSGSGVAVTAKCLSKNPKRRQREARRQMQQGIHETKSQQAIKLQQDQLKLVKAKKHQENRVCERRNRFLKQREKKKARHRGH